MYARKLTREDLMIGGITNVTEDGRVFRGEEELIPVINKNGYFMHSIYELDENGNKIKIMKKNSAFGYVYKRRAIGLHRVMWAWFYNEVPDGMVVDHISNQHSELKDYELTNLQLLTPKENVRKNRVLSTREIKCKLNKPRSYYEDILTQTSIEYEQAKKDKDQVAAHHLRTKMSQYRARLRYYDAHIGENNIAQ
jgi:hypothetical protein